MTDVELSVIETASIHATRLELGLSLIAHLIPFTPEKVKMLDVKDLPNVDFMIGRFSKLQDLIGNKILKQALAIKKEETENKSYIDILNLSEKLYFIPDKNDWLEMRDLRNHLTHEYPHNPELTADYLNKAVDYAKKILDIWYNLKKIMEEKQ